METYWSKTYPIKAVRLTRENIRPIAEELGGGYFEIPKGYGDERVSIPYIEYYGSRAGIGDWYVIISDLRKFLKHEEFEGNFWKHTEEAAENEKYANVYQLVMYAMRKQDAATYHENSDGMDLVAAETTKRILGEL